MMSSDISKLQFKIILRLSYEKEAVNMKFKSGGYEEEGKELKDGDDHAPLSMTHWLAVNKRKRSE